MSRIVICPICNKEWELRWGIFAHDSLSRHMKDIIESTSRNDFVECKWGAMFLDGGDDYLRYGAKDFDMVRIINA